MSMKISILLVSYNHIDFIHRCLDGILSQEFGQKIEIVVADDCSSDGTGERIKERLDNQFFEVVYLKGQQNLGLGKNYLRGLSVCRGEYVAIIEGDDFWVDPNRLQKHIDFMDRQPQCPMSFNLCSIFNESTQQLIVPSLNGTSAVKYYDSKTLIHYNVIGNLSTCVIRNSVLRGIPKEWFEYNITDWFLGIALAEIYPVAQLNEVMSVYRFNPQGLWSRHSDVAQNEFKYKLTYTYDWMLGYRFTRSFYSFRLASTIKRNRDVLMEKSPDFFNFIMKNFITQGVIYRFTKFVSLLIPIKLIKKDEEVFSIF